MIQIVEDFLKKYSLTQPDTDVLVGFSGGYDSLCLLDILDTLKVKYNFNLIALHLNHNWRAEESLQDKENCRIYCEKNNICFASTTLENIQKTENAAREARYNFFVSQARKYSNPVIFTAHSATDNAETLIYRIIKGTGLKGLQGIPEFRLEQNIRIYRPLIEISRNQIIDYCNSKGLVANVDSSNKDTSYKRNFIRQKITPLFNEINPKHEKALNSLAKQAISQNNIIQEYLDKVYTDIKDDISDNKILTPKFLKYSSDIQKRVIYDIFLELNLDYDSKKIDYIFNFIQDNYNSKSGSRCSLSSNLWLFVSEKYIYTISDIQAKKESEEIQVNGAGKYNYSNFALFSINKFSGTNVEKFPRECDFFAYVDLTNIEDNLSLRTRKEGDYITPFGMVGKMKLKKYLNLKGIPNHQKDGLILLARGSEILWVAGVGLSNKLKVVNTPTHVIRLDIS